MKAFFGLLLASFSLLAAAQEVSFNCPLVPVKNLSAEFEKEIKGVSSRFEKSIVLALKESANVVVELGSIGAAKQTALLAENLCQIAALTPDVSLVSDLMPLEQFKRLTTPRSFKASLFQMIREMTDSFILSDNGMNRMMLSLVALPDLLGSTTEILTEKDPDGKGFILRTNLDRISDTAEICSSESDKIATKFDDTLLTLSELIQASITCESNTKMQKKLKEAERNAFEHAMKAEKEIKEKTEADEREMKANVQKTLRSYEKQVKKMGSLGYLIIGSIMDAINGGIKAFGAVFGAKLGGLGGGGGGSGGGGQGQTSTEALSGGKGTCVRFLSSVVGQVPTKVPEKEREDFVNLLGYAITNELVKPCATIVDKIERLKTALSNLNPSDNQTASSYESVLEETKGALAEQEAQSGGESSGGSPSSGGGSGGVLDTLAKGAADLRQQYQFQEQMRDRLRDKVAKSAVTLSGLMAKLDQINLETADLSEIIQYLREALIVLNESRELWINISRFFTRFKDMAKDVLVKNIEEFEKYSNQLADRRVRLIEQRMLQLATRLTSECVAMYFCAQTYTEFSKNHIMPIIAGVGKSLQLTKEEALRLKSTARARMDTQMCQVQQYLVTKMNDAMDFTRKRAIEFMKEYVQSGIEDPEQLRLN